MTSGRNSQLHYEVLQRDGGYAIVSREYGIVVRCTDLAEGAAELNSRVEALRRDFESVGMSLPSKADDIREQELVRPARRQPIQRGVILASIVVLLVIAAAYPAVSFLSGIRQSISSVLPQAPGVDGAGRLAIDAVNRLADATEQITPERERELRDSLEKIARKFAPLMRTVTEPFATAPGKAASCP